MKDGVSVNKNRITVARRIILVFLIIWDGLNG